MFTSSLIICRAVPAPEIEQLSAALRPETIRAGMKQLTEKTPIFGSAVLRIFGSLTRAPATRSSKIFRGSEAYWKERYDAGGHSGRGSYDELAQFKADILNKFVSENKITSVIDYGCGDGNQLSLAQYPQYTGFDVSPNALERCLKRFSNDKTKTFKLMEEYKGETAQLTLALDVIYHLVEDSVYCDYMNRLFDSAERFVIIYSSDTDETPAGTAAHVRHRKFSAWIDSHKPEWKLTGRIPNKYPLKADYSGGSFADFYIYSRT
jgi:SAM-dependent methyltransferase